MTGPRSSSVATRVAALVFALSAVLAAAAPGLELAPWFATLCGVLTLTAGAGFPVLIAWSPVEPSLLKLTLCGSLLAPIVASGVYLSARAAGCDAQVATSVTFGCIALAQLLAWRERLTLQPLGRGGALILLVASCCAASVAWGLFGAGNGARSLHEGALWHASVAQVVGDLRFENPWLAGTDLLVHPGYDLFGHVVSQLTFSSTLVAFAGAAVWSAFWTPVALYLLAAPLWRDARADVLSVLFALFGWNALGGLGAWPAAFDERWATALAQGTLGESEGSVWYGLASWFAVAPWSVCALYACGGWLAAAHALRHAGRPWVGLCAGFLGVAFCVQPVYGGLALLAVWLTALLHPGAPGVRLAVLGPLSVCALPGFWLVRRFGWETHAVPTSDAALAWVALWPAVLPVVAALGAFAWRPTDDARGRRTILALVLAASLLPLGAAAGGLLPNALCGRALRLASLPLGVLAAGGALAGWSVRPLRPLLALTVLALALGGGRATWLAQRAQFAWQPATVPIDDRSPAVAFEPAPGQVNQRDIAGMYAYLRSADELRARRPVLVRSLQITESSARATLPHAAPIVTGLPLWVDRSRLLARDHPRWAPRFERIRDLYGSRKEWDPYLLEELRRMERPGLFLVEEEDRIATHRGERDKRYRGVDLRLERLGCTRLHEVGSVTLYLWDPETE